jgi:hypothetical protein
MIRPSKYYRAPGVHSYGRLHWLDADLNTRFPFGISICLYLGRQADPPPCEPDCEPDCEWHKAGAPQGCGFTLDLNGPLGEPNRLYLWGRRRNIILGLPSWHREVELSRTHGSDGKPIVRTATVRSWPRLEAMPRYRYHEIAGQGWVRNDKPERLHWGWLTIEQRIRDT